MYSTKIFSVRICRLLVWMVLSVLVGSFTPAVSIAQQSLAAQPVQKLTMTVIFDNNPYKEGLENRHGFSCLIQGLEETILFDTGGGSILLTNMEKLGFHPQEIDVVVLSHSDFDHVGGLSFFLRANHNVTVYLLNSFSEFSKDSVRKSGANIVEVQESVNISGHAYSSGELGERGYKKEQALILQTDKGLIVIIGCAHPGIVAMVQKAKELLNDDVLLVMGGFHLGDKNRTTLGQIVSELKQLGVQYVGPCHCSGDLARQVFEEAYQSNFIPVGVGTVVRLEDLQ